MIRVSNGNKKIGNDTLILNMCSATDCPSKRLGLCDIHGSKCYARKAERLYPNVLPYRRDQEIYWQTHSSSEIAKELQGIIERKRAPVRYIRLSEAGDFEEQRDVDKTKDIARRMSEVIIYVYTARRDLRYTRLPSNLIVNGSGFMVSNQFTAVDRVRDNETICPGDCRTCDLCKTSGGVDIKVRYH